MAYEAAKTTDKMIIQIVSKENIVPSSPTPDHLRTYKLSVLDHIAVNLYIPLILFYPNNNTSNLNTVIFDRSKFLKKTLSQTLSQFHPIAGKVKDDFQIDCNDKGVYYIETRTNISLSDFLSQSPGNEMISQLIPGNATESAIGNYVLVIQVNFFSCGGITICSCINHKFIDGDTYTLFFRHWTATARGSLEKIYPNYSASTLFPQIPSPYIQNPESFIKPKFVSQRFVFDGINLAALKSETSVFTLGNEPTRFEVVAALLWKCVAKATYTVNNSSLEKPFNLVMAINLRGKNCVPKNAVGNLVWHGLAECKLAPDLEHHYLVNQIKKSKAQVNDDFIEVMKGDAGAPAILKYGEMMMMSHSVVITTMCNMGVYELDFGWGKPMWFYYGNVCVMNFISLCETRLGAGMEAVVSLCAEEMAIFENDPELLAFASLNPAPL